MRYATIGTSWITESFIQGASLAGGMELTAVHSRTRDKGQALAEAYGGAAVFTDWEEMARSHLFDAVYIASPNALHYPQSRTFLENGKHVLCEKPATVTSAQMRELRELANSRNLVYMEAIMMRHLPSRAILHDALPQIGRISTARFDFSQCSSKYPALLAGELPNIFNPAMAGGCLMDLGIYCVYAAVDLFGCPSRITASAGFVSSGADGYGAAMLDYPDKQVTLTYSKVGQGLAGSEIIGEAGTLTIRSVSEMTGIALILKNNHRESLVGDIDRPTLMRGEAGAFRRFVSHPLRHAEELSSVGDLTLAVCEVMEEIRRQCGIRFSKDT